MRQVEKRAHLDVGVQSVRTVDGRGSLVPLHAVLFEGGDVAGVCVSQARYHHLHIWAPRLCHLLDMSTPTSMGLSCVSYFCRTVTEFYRHASMQQLKPNRNDPTKVTLLKSDTLLQPETVYDCGTNG